MTETVYSEDYLSYQTDRSWLRKLVRKAYLWQVRRNTIGRVLDFGCGVGEHLATFPGGSMGLEVNAATVRYCKSRGLNVEEYNPEEDKYELRGVPEKRVDTLVISHVLEHLEQPDQILKKLLDSSKRLGIKRFYITVPCEAGFAHDKTHVTFITKEYVESHGLDRYNGYELRKMGYFPFNLKWVGKYFTYNEFYWICEQRG